MSLRDGIGEMTEMAKEEISREQQRFEARLAKRRAKKVLRQRAQTLVAAVDGFEATITERDKILRPGITELLNARDGLRDALEGKVNG